MRRTTLAAALALVVLTAGAASAQPPVPEPPKPEQLFIAPSGQPFRAPPGAPYPVAQWFAQADKRGDGKVDRAEVRADATAFFNQLDANHDGVLDPFEMQAYEQKVAPEILGAYRVPVGAEGQRGRADRHTFPAPAGRGRGGPNDSGAQSVLDGAAPYSLTSTPEPIAGADLDSDGHVTLAEFLTVVDHRFDKLDPKGRGYLTLADLPKTQAQRDAEPKRRR